MISLQETTVAEDVIFEGVSLHGGIDTKAVIKPAKAGEGISFSIETDAGSERIDVTPHAVVATKLGTTIANDSGYRISTIEHLMAALAICGVSNAHIIVDGGEIPIMDGSAEPVVEIISAIGIRELGVAKSRLKVAHTVEVRDGDRYVRIEPSEVASLSLTISFDDEAIGESTVEIDLEDTEALLKRLAPARTFCRLGEVAEMKSAGLALGGSLENAVVVDGARILNTTGLRDIQEFALHKALDLIGDMALIGMPLVGRITAGDCRRGQRASMLI